MTTIPSAAAPAGGFKWMFFSLDGRATRSNWWIWGFVGLGIAGFVAGFIANLIDGILGTMIPPGIGILSLIVNLAFIYPAVCISGKRWHDRNKSAWFVLIVYVPMIVFVIGAAFMPNLATIIGIIFFVGALWTLVECGFMRGTVGDNRFGSDPLAGK
jgi:uncharacterized membrane protein YhaH (DUF805 family)